MRSPQPDNQPPNRPVDLGAPLKGQAAPTPGEAHRKQVPPTPELRGRIDAEVERWLSEASPPASRWRRRDFEFVARRVLSEFGLPDDYLGWTMVAVASAVWREHVAHVPVDRRLLLLPRCLRNDECCPAQYDETGLLCADCGACGLSALRAEARELGYRVLIAEGSPAVMKLILRGSVDAIVGVGCLDALEKTLDSLLSVGVPAMAVPLLCDGCRDTRVDEAAVRRMFHTPYRPGGRSGAGGEASPDAGHGESPGTHGYLPLMREAASLFDPATLDRLAPMRRLEQAAVAPEQVDAAAFTEAAAREFLIAGGKHSRPFITLATYAALTGTTDRPADIPDAVRAVALATEVFHKASLVHDDVEDDDPFRYGRPTLHRRFGTATAVNIGDYLIGLGYRLIADQHGTVPGEAIGELLRVFTSAHMRLCEGQGAELRLREAGQSTEGRGPRAEGPDQRDSAPHPLTPSPPHPLTPPTPLEVLKIHALKTAPAFEAALAAGICLAEGSSMPSGEQGSANVVGWVLAPTRLAMVDASNHPTGEPTAPPREAVARFARHLGVAYQIVNDLDDWAPDSVNKRTAGHDLLSYRPTILWAFAWEKLDETARARLMELLGGQKTADFPSNIVSACGELYESAGVFERARSLCRKHHERALEAVEAMAVGDDPSPRITDLQRLLRFLADAILDRQALTPSGPRP